MHIKQHIIPKGNTDIKIRFGQFGRDAAHGGVEQRPTLSYIFSLSSIVCVDRLTDPTLNSTPSAQRCSVFILVAASARRQRAGSYMYMMQPHYNISMSSAAFEN